MESDREGRSPQPSVPTVEELERLHASLLPQERDELLREHAQPFERQTRSFCSGRFFRPAILPPFVVSSGTAR
jgi:hypothetical protein